MDSKWSVVVMRDKTVVREDPFEDYYKARAHYDNLPKVEPAEGHLRVKLRDRAGTTFCQGYVSI